MVNGIQNINVFDELEVSYKLGKPLLIYFTAIGCVNCRKMEQLVLDDEEINAFIEEKFRFIPLCMDDRNNLPQDHWVNISRRKRPLKKASEINNYFQIVIARAGGQPRFIILDENRKLGLYSYTAEKEEFLNFLKKAIKNYK